MGMSRKTSMTLEQLIEQLPEAVSCCGSHCGNGGSGYPVGMLVNKIGQIFNADTDESDAAEKKLAELLTSDDWGVRWIAGQYLVDSSRPLSAETTEALRLYDERAVQANAAIAAQAEAGGQTIN
jgi:hypothetical protein